MENDRKNRPGGRSSDNQDLRPGSWDSELDRRYRENNPLLGNRISETPKETIKCPLCKSINIEDNSVTNNNGVIGPGYASWKVTDTRVCKDCGILFIPTLGNGL